METYKCKTCGIMFSRKLRQCPHCGENISVLKKLLVGFGVLVFLVMIAVMIDFQIHPPQMPKPEARAPIIPASEVINTNPKSDGCNVPMKDGSYESTRCNDLEELAKDWLFYRKKTLIAHREGDEEAENKYRNSFQQINRWLSKYKDSDVSDMISRLEGQDK
jgi:hypothetical protein